MTQISRLGRPPVAEAAHLSHIINFRVTADEYGLITAAALKDKQGLSEWIRTCATGVADIVVNDPSFELAPCEACGHVPQPDQPDPP